MELEARIHMCWFSKGWDGNLTLAKPSYQSSLSSFSGFFQGPLQRWEGNPGVKQALVPNGRTLILAGMCQGLKRQMKDPSHPFDFLRCILGSLD